MELACMIFGRKEREGRSDVAILRRHLPIERQLPAVVSPCQTGGITVSGIDIKGGAARHHPVESDVIIGIRHQSTCVCLCGKQEECTQEYEELQIFTFFCSHVINSLK